MRTREPFNDKPYIAECYGCGGAFDALKAEWCGCLTDESSLVCPSCLRCFCTTPKSYRDNFWDSAPQSLWDVKIKNEKIYEAPQSLWDGKMENVRVISYNPNLTPETVIRPLVLVVDNTPGILRTASRAIAGLGYGTILARDGVNGLALARQYKPELILSDILIPGLDAMKFCRIIKSDLDTRDIKFILMTSLYRRGKQLSTQAPVDDYVKKPLDSTQLSQLLNKHRKLKTGIPYGRPAGKLLGVDPDLPSL